MYNSDDFALMIKDWQADSSPEYDDLVINSPEIDSNGAWMSTTYDAQGVMYSLTDDGTGNIVINYLGSRKGWGGKRPNSGRPSTGRKKRPLYITDDEYLKVKQLIEELRKPSE